MSKSAPRLRSRQRNNAYMPTILLVNKMDRDNVRVRRVMESIDANLDIRVVPLQLPIGEGPSFEGVVDLLSMQARLGEKGIGRYS